MKSYAVDHLRKGLNISRESKKPASQPEVETVIFTIYQERVPTSCALRRTNSLHRALSTRDTRAGREEDAWFEPEAKSEARDHRNAREGRDGERTITSTVQPARATRIVEIPYNDPHRHRR